MKTPIKSMMAKARGEDLKKTAVAEGMADTVSSPRAGGFDENKQVAGEISTLPLEGVVPNPTPHPFRSR